MCSAAVRRGHVRRSPRRPREGASLCKVPHYAALDAFAPQPLSCFAFAAYAYGYVRVSERLPSSGLIAAAGRS